MHTSDERHLVSDSTNPGPADPADQPAAEAAPQPASEDYPDAATEVYPESVPTPRPRRTPSRSPMPDRGVSAARSPGAARLRRSGPACRVRCRSAGVRRTPGVRRRSHVRRCPDLRRRSRVRGCPDLRRRSGVRRLRRLRHAAQDEHARDRVAHRGASRASFIIPFIGSIVAVITGHMSLSQIKRTGEGGRGLGLAGTIVGWVGIGLGDHRLIDPAAGADPASSSIERAHVPAELATERTADPATATAARRTLESP